MDSQASGKTATQQKKGGNGRKVAVVVVVLIVIAALVGIILYLLSRKPAEEPVADDDLRNVVITQDNLEDQMAKMGEQEFTEPGYYTVTMNNVWNFPDSKSVSTNAYVENEIGNTNDVYFDIFLASDESKAIYESPVLPIGSSLDKIALDTDLDPGTYDCVMIYHLVDEDQNTLSTLRVAVTIIIEG